MLLSKATYKKYISQKKLRLNIAVGTVKYSFIVDVYSSIVCSVTPLSETMGESKDQCGADLT